MKCVSPAFELEASKEEQRDVVNFLDAEGALARKIHHHMSSVYGEHYIPDKCA